MNSSTILLTTTQVNLIYDRGFTLDMYYILERISQSQDVNIIKGSRVTIELLTKERFLNAEMGVTKTGMKLLKDVASAPFGKEKSIDGKTELEVFTEKFQALFPEVKLPTGKQFKSNLRDLGASLLVFSKKYRYSQDIILTAARAYVEHARLKRYEYIKTAAYFVYKDRVGSELADWCERVGNRVESSEGSNIIDI